MFKLELNIVYQKFVLSLTFLFVSCNNQAGLVINLDNNSCLCLENQLDTSFLVDNYFENHEELEILILSDIYPKQKMVRLKNKGSSSIYFHDTSSSRYSDLLSLSVTGDNELGTDINSERTGRFRQCLQRELYAIYRMTYQSVQLVKVMIFNGKELKPHESYYIDLWFAESGNYRVSVYYLTEKESNGYWRGEHQIVSDVFRIG